jgi:hypothetical protein
MHHIENMPCGGLFLFFCETEGGTKKKMANNKHNDMHIHFFSIRFCSSI